MTESASDNYTFFSLPSATMVMWICHPHPLHHHHIQYIFNRIQVVCLFLHLYCQKSWGTSVCVLVARISIPNSQLHLMTYVSGIRNGAHLCRLGLRRLSPALAMYITISTPTVCGFAVHGMSPCCLKYRQIFTHCWTLPIRRDRGKTFKFNYHESVMFTW